MLIKVNPTQLVIVKSSLTEHAKIKIDKAISKIDNKVVFDTSEHIKIVSSQKELYMLLYVLSTEFDIELM